MVEELKVSPIQDQITGMCTISSALQKLHDSDISKLTYDLKTFYVEYQGSTYIDSSDKEYNRDAASRFLDLLEVLNELEKPLKEGHHNTIEHIALYNF